MRRILSRIFTIALLCLLFSACQKDETLIYSAFSIGNFTSGVFTSDEGQTYNIVEQTCEGRLDTMKRAFIVCDILERVNGQKDAFNIRLKEIHSVLSKDVLKSDEIDEESVGSSPINLASGWVSKGYFNIIFNFTYFAESLTKHFINLVIDKEKSTDENVVLQLRHNGYDETLDKASDNDLAKVRVGTGYASFRIDDLIPEGKDKISTTVNWVWHSQMGGVLDKETVPMTSNGVLWR
ncbi:MAG: hypothetical protein MJZ16_05290 [Bacteroidales bacterium]|nr:hypothetical protein [Bacteroidales bacterium]